MTPRARRRLAWLLTLASVVALRLLAPDPVMRREWALLVLLPLGYGHQLAALPSRRCHRRRPERRLQALISAAVASGICWLLAGPMPHLALVLLAGVALWHVLENAIALERCEPADAERPALPPLSRSGWAHARVLCACVAVGVLMLAVPRLALPALRAGVPTAWAVWTIEELFAVLLLHHVVSFLLWGIGGSDVGGGRRSRVVALHLAPLAIAMSARFAWPSLLELLGTPSLYLLCSLFHAIQTAGRRGIASR